MAGKITTYSNSFLKLIFQAVNWANLADNTATSPLTTLYISLHTADPGVAGSQTTNEAAYTGYARVGVARTSSGWTVTNNVASPVNPITFPAGTGGSGTVTFFGIGSAASGAGVLFYSGTVTPNIVTGNGVTPQLSTSTTVTES